MLGSLSGLTAIVIEGGVTYRPLKAKKETVR
jgi:hypothetical protein